MTIRNEILEPVQRVLHWMLRHRDKDGRIICPEHGIEHTGKNAGAIVMACELAPHTDFADELFDVAVQQGRRLVERLEREGESTCFTFRPGRHDPYNCSNNVIDGGIAAYGDDFLPRINAEFEREGRRPLQRIEALTVRPSRDLGIVAGELLQGRHGPFELSRFLNFVFRAFRRVGVGNR